MGRKLKVGINMVRSSRKAFTIPELAKVLFVIAIIVFMTCFLSGGRPTPVDRGNGVWVFPAYGNDFATELAKWKGQHPSLRVVNTMPAKFSRGIPYEYIVNVEPKDIGPPPVEKP